MSKRRDHPAWTSSGEFFNEMDISKAMRGWPYETGQINVRLIQGNDGKLKLQMRLDLGLLQMELEGRPDGRRPHRRPTELEYQRSKLAQHTKRVGTDAGFHLSSADCQALRDESAMFYHRYLSLFVLEQFDAVTRDTQHNLDVLNMCRQYARTEADRMVLEQYRPYILMMHARAKACASLRQGFVQTALAYLRGGIRQIGRLAPREQRREFLHASHEAPILLDMIRQIRSQLPADPREELRKRLKVALANERFEEAARLRDQLLTITLDKPRKRVAHKARRKA